MALTQALFNQAIVTESIENGLDRKQLKELQRRFISLNQQRLDRTLSALNYQQQRFVALLPIFFHANHPLLPGYLGHNSASGIADYKPSKIELKNVKALARSFRLAPQTGQTEDIESIFLMGSMGTIAHSRTSDIDVWLCYRDDLPKKDILSLEQKCKKLTAHAKELRLDCHFFVMNAQQFKQGKGLALSSEASGSTQHVLLLDEFYRTALWLAGKKPLWWFVPPAREQHYQDYRHQLLSKRYIHNKNVVDFGPVANIPGAEFAGAALWQLYKAIESPFKSLFKLILLEVYTYTFPGYQPLCLSFKDTVYDHDVDIDELDPYVVAYRRIEYHLTQREEFERLELVRRCLYFKTNIALSSQSAKIEKPWQFQLLNKLVKEWGWTPEHIQLLDNRKKWKAALVVKERNAIVKELLTSYQRLQSFTQKLGAAVSVDRKEFSTLGHKLYANYERRRGKVEWVNPGISNDLSETYLCFVEDKADQKEQADHYPSPLWRVYAANKSALESQTNRRTDKPSPLKHSSLMELILWCHCNELLAPGTRSEFIFRSPSADKNSAKVYPLIRAVQQWLPLPLPPVRHQTFQNQPRTTHLFIHVNLGKESNSQFNDNGMVQITNVEDAFVHGEFKNNLVKSVDLVSRNTWNEINCHHYENDGANLLDNNALILCLRTCLQLCIHPEKQEQVLPEVRVHCGSTNSGNIIRHRVETILFDLLRCYNNKTRSLSSRYILSIENGYYACQCSAVSDDKIQARFECLTSEDHLYDYLSRTQATPSPLIFDRYALVTDALKLLAKVSHQRAIQFVYRVEGNRANLFVLDEQGSLFIGEVAYYNDDRLLRSMHYFFRDAIEQQQQNGGDYSALFGVFPIHFYKLLYRNQNQAYLEPKHCTSDITSLAGPQLKVEAAADALGNESLIIHVDSEPFDQRLLGAKFYSTVKQFIAKQSQHGIHPPAVVSHLNLQHYHLPGLKPEQWQISHYLRFKTDIEAQINPKLPKLV